MCSHEGALRILELSGTPTIAEIKHAYRRLSLRHHPDKNSNSPASIRTFQKITGAYEALCAPLAFPEPCVAAHHAATTSPLVVNVQVTLEQAFAGVLVPVKIQRSIAHGTQSYTEDETIYVDIPQGADSGEVIIHRRKGNIVNASAPGDLKLVVVVEEHPHFERHGLDLRYKKPVSLKQALCGGAFELMHISGKSYTIRNSKGVVLSPSSSKSIPNLGMRRAGHVGNLVIHFEIVFPRALNDEQIQVLAQTL